MFAKQYLHRLPADYDMAKVRARIVQRGPMWNKTAGLGFKAFSLQDRARGWPRNAYSSIYLWLDTEAATAFLTSDRFRAVVDTFSRPRIETWLPLDVRRGRAPSAQSIVRHDEIIAADADLGRLQAAERERNADLAARDDILAVVSAVDVTDWRLARFTLSAGAADPTSLDHFEIGHLAAPGLSRLA